MSDIQLLVVDLDGTLLGGSDEFALYASFRQKIAELKTREGFTWAISTGRSLESCKRFISPLSLVGAVPDYLIVEHAFIYGRSRYHYAPHIIWNLSTRYALWLHRLNVSHALEEWCNLIMDFSPRARIVCKSKNRLWVRFDSEETTRSIAAVLKDRVVAFKTLKMFRFLKEIDIRPVPFTKGLALYQLARRLKTPKDNILAIGDGHNDISMLDGSVASLTGCPANAAAEVMRVVHEHGGHIAKHNTLAGVIEIIAAHQSDNISSGLPPTWQDPETAANPTPEPGLTKKRKSAAGRIGTILLILASAYTAMLVFAQYGAIPYTIARFILLPFNKCMTLLQKMLL